MQYKASRFSAVAAGVVMAFWYAFLDIHMALTVVTLIILFTFFVVGIKQVADFWSVSKLWEDFPMVPFKDLKFKEFHVPAFCRFILFLLGLVITGSLLKLV